MRCCAEILREYVIPLPHLNASGCPFPIRGCCDMSKIISTNFLNNIGFDFLNFDILLPAVSENSIEYVIISQDVLLPPRACCIACFYPFHTPVATPPRGTEPRPTIPNRHHQPAQAYTPAYSSVVL